MEFRWILGVILCLALIDFSLAQETSESINIQREIDKFAYSSQLPINMAGDLTNVVLDEPLVIVGSNLDLLERRILSQATNYLSSSEYDIVYDDSIIEFEGRSIWSYDLILIGGPNHNQLTKTVLDKGYLGVSTRNTNRPFLMLEKSIGPGGKTILVGGDIYGYTYDEKDLPVEPFIPESVAAVAAVATGVGVGTIASIFESLKNFLLGGVRELFEKRMGDTKKRVGKMGFETADIVFLGFTSREIGVGIFSILLFGAAYSWADGQSFSHLGIYVIAAGIAIIGHEFAHDFMANRYKVGAKFELWTSGLVLVLATSFLFGNVFATTGRNILEIENLDKRTKGLIFSAGPMINILIAIILLPISKTAGSLGQLAAIGIPINLVIATYNFLPISPMDGKHIKNWNSCIWLLLFVPTFSIFFWKYLF
jgi:Zn-dependent protease